MAFIKEKGNFSKLQFQVHMTVLHDVSESMLTLHGIQNISQIGFTDFFFISET